MIVLATRVQVDVIDPDNVIVTLRSNKDRVVARCRCSSFTEAAALARKARRRVEQLRNALSQGEDAGVHTHALRHLFPDGG